MGPSRDAFRLKWIIPQIAEIVQPARARLARSAAPAPGNPSRARAFFNGPTDLRRTIMGFGRGALLWLLGIPLPIILLLALFWHN
jgi:hypothetical protein